MDGRQAAAAAVTGDGVEEEAMSPPFSPPPTHENTTTAGLVNGVDGSRDRETDRLEDTDITTELGTGLEAVVLTSPPAISVEADDGPRASTNDDDEDKEQHITSQLLQKRAKIDQEIEDFRAAKEAEYREFEAALRAEVEIAAGRTTTTGTREQGGHETQIQSVTTTTGGAHVQATGVDDELKDRLQQHMQESSSSSATREELAARSSSSSAAAPTPPSPENDETAEKREAFEQELQIAGLFAPTFLPLLDSRYRLSPAVHTPVMQKNMSSVGTATETMPPPKLTDTPPISRTNGSSGSGTPTYPLASSLKSTSSGSSGTNCEKKPKSPKKVTFQFEDESLVPSRSSPPPTKVVWKVGVIHDDWDGDDLDDEEEGEVGELNVEDVTVDSSGRPLQELLVGDDLSDTDDQPTAQQIEDISNSIETSVDITKLRLSGVERYHGSDLVTPQLSLLSSSQGERDAVSQPPPSSAHSSQSSTSLDSNPKSPFAALSASISAFTRPQSAMNGLRDLRHALPDEDEDMVFDLDETIPDEPPRSPPRRDLSPLLAATPEPKHQLPPSSFSLSASFNPANVPLPQSVPKDPPSFAKAPVSPSPSLIPNRGHQRNHLGGSFNSYSPFQLRNRPSTDLVSPSLPTFSGFPESFNPSDGDKIRRRSVIKYIPSPPPEEADEDTTDPTTTTTGPSPYASSLPVTIHPHLTTLRSPPPSTSPVTKPSSSTTAINPDTLSGRPTPSPHQPDHHSEPLPFQPDHDDTDLDLLSASPPRAPTSSNELDSYQRSDRFSSGPRPSSSASNTTVTAITGLLSPYKTRFAQELAEAALKEGETGEESFVGGVDGGTGFDEVAASVRGASFVGRGGVPPVGIGSAHQGQGMGSQPEASLRGGGGFSFSQRMAMEEAMEGGGRRR
ncbi:hypothetical protein EX30DRAFT_367233 [Ascodesmis nigricans]|uniref:Uncharacterized protein n=1 Tax=Ascodesmis nigricans TaxID=341454 RepID=A0A4S2MIX8_9PEZI|nr:hypothetical protein EX30DRAFT_367233 [Ascodesmis nigricans]